VALSAVSVHNAKLNLQQELPHWNFERVVSEAERAWNTQLGKVVIETPHVEDKRVFYTALYHTMIAPSLFCDVNGEYRGADTKVYHDTTFTNYTTLSLWDTYRAAHPLMSIIHPDLAKDFGNTM